MVNIKVIEGNAIAMGIQFFNEARCFIDAIKDAAQEMTKGEPDNCPDCPEKEACKGMSATLADKAEAALAAMQEFADAFNKTQDLKKAAHDKRRAQSKEGGTKE